MLMMTETTTELPGGSREHGATQAGCDAVFPVPVKKKAYIKGLTSRRRPLRGTTDGKASFWH